MKRLITCSQDEDNIIDVSEYNSKMEKLYVHILDTAPFKPSEHTLWGKGMTYSSSNQPQVYSLTFKWSPDMVDGGFELDVRVNSFVLKSAINNPPDVTCKITTFLNAKTYQEFADASDKLTELFLFADEIRQHVSRLF